MTKKIIPTIILTIGLTVSLYFICPIIFKELNSWLMTHGAFMNHWILFHSCFALTFGLQPLIGYFVLQKLNAQSFLNSILFMIFNSSFVIGVFFVGVKIISGFEKPAEFYTCYDQQHHFWNYVIAITSLVLPTIIYFLLKLKATETGAILDAPPK